MIETIRISFVLNFDQILQHKKSKKYTVELKNSSFFEVGY